MEKQFCKIFTTLTGGTYLLSLNFPWQTYVLSDKILKSHYLFLIKLNTRSKKSKSEMSSS